MRKVRAVLMVLGGTALTVLTGSVVTTVFYGGCDYGPGQLLNVQLRTIGAKVEAYQMDTGAFPSALSEMVEDLNTEGWQGPYARVADLRDPWGRPFFYRVEADGAAFQLFSLGRDGRLGGADEDRDQAIVFGMQE